MRYLNFLSKLTSPAPGWRIASFILFGVIPTFFVVRWAKLNPGYHIHDPDRYYHLRLSEQMQNDPIPKKFPQAPDIGWADYFPEKEFLFHQITALAHRIGGEKAVEQVPYIITAATVLSTIYIASTFVAMPAAALLTLPAFFLSGRLLVRLFLLRAMNLAVLIFVWYLYALIRENIAMIFITSALFVLAYHAFYVPLFFLGIYALSRLYGRAPFMRCVMAGVLGVAAGMILSPYFPDNFLVALQHLRIATQSHKIGIEMFGVELIPIRSDLLVREFGLHLLTGCLCIAMFGNLLSKARVSQTVNNLNFLFLSVACALFSVLVFYSPRVMEFTPPATAIALSMLVSFFGAQLRACIFIVGLGFVIQFASLRSLLHAQESVKNIVFENSKSAFQEVKEETTAKKVFNCSWDTAPYIYYIKPTFRFVDLLDPSFLLLQNEGLFRAKYSLQEGKVTDPFYLVRYVFESDFTYCNSGISQAFERDPHFRRLYPNTNAQAVNAGNWLYQVADSYRPELVRKYLHGGWWIGARNLIPDLDKFLVDYQTWSVDDDQNIKPPFVDLFKLQSAFSGDFLRLKDVTDAKDQSNWICAQVMPDRDEIARLANSDMLVIKGGHYLRLYLNGQKLFRSNVLGRSPLDHGFSVDLNAPLSASDRLQGIVCSPSGSSYFGLSMSLWQKNKLRTLCVDKGADRLLFEGRGREWQKQSATEIEYCLAPRAENILEKL